MKTNSKASLPACRKGKIALSEPPLTEFDTKLELIQMLIPIALERVQEVLQQEVAELAGPAPPPNKHMDAGRSPRYVHNDSRGDHKRPKARLGWGKPAGGGRLRLFGRAESPTSGAARAAPQAKSGNPACELSPPAKAPPVAGAMNSSFSGFYTACRAESTNAPRV